MGHDRDIFERVVVTNMDNPKDHSADHARDAGSSHAPAVGPFPCVGGRYVLGDEIASGGMATVHLGRLLGQVGFARIVAIKRLHAQHARDPDFVSMFLDEARLAARIRHPNVVSTLDVVDDRGELFLVLDYVHGEALSALCRTLHESGSRVPLNIASSILVDTLLGLHAAHEAKDERGHPLGIVHRDVSPHNVLVGVDGVARIFDFGVAKAQMRLQTTREGQLKGKMPYMAPEQLSQASITRRTDIFAAGVVLWEVLTGKRLFDADNAGAIVARILLGQVSAPSRLVPDLPPELDQVVLRATAGAPEQRFRSAREMADALEQAVAPCRRVDVGDWVSKMAEHTLQERTARISFLESALGNAETVDASSVDEQASRGSIVTLAEAMQGLEDRTPKVPPRSSGVALPTETDHSEFVQEAARVSIMPRTRHAELAIALIVLALASAAAAMLWPRTSKRAATQTMTTATQATYSPPVPSESPDHSLASPSVRQPSLPADKTASPSATPRATSAFTPRQTPRSSGVDRAVAPRKPACNPPYIIDPSGAKRFKPECF